MRGLIGIAILGAILAGIAHADSVQVECKPVIKPRIYCYDHVGSPFGRRPLQCRNT